MLHFCCAENIVAMVLRHLPKFSSTSLEALLVEESIQKKRQKKPIFIYGTTSRKMEEIFSESKFYCSQKQKKNYGRHTGMVCVGAGSCQRKWQGRLPRIARLSTKCHPKVQIDHNVFLYYLLYGRVKPHFDKSF
jgi:hypothetical protein